MAITIPVLAVVIAAFVLPNYLAIRYAMLGDTVAVTAAAGGKASATVTPMRRSVRVPAFVQRGFMWKALSPFVFAVAFILGIAVGGTLGAGIAGFGFLNLLWGMVGWSGNRPGKRHY